MKVKINEIVIGMSNLSVEGEVTRKNEEKIVRTRYGKKRVANAVLKDETGEIELVLWEDQIDMIREGDKIEIEKAYVTQWKGKLQLNIPKRGSIKIKNK